ncbi:hypothetical protein [Allonocardiopsis opalescens]|uniref:Uncharacterized protein n=1 Tax=Allonocardiopsis opalescens TaxID=1144618 RepID=A0A2T0PP47_9ACTN|nr:hypothetical protein [Allonocardiopsis opalescens]PRX90664.1 hypothetical protein CLV72_1182 [Allonocardiopsis opalescens]
MPDRRFFILHLPDGRALDGAQFPSGRVVTDDPAAGLAHAAVSVDALLDAYPGARLEYYVGGASDSAASEPCDCPGCRSPTAAPTTADPPNTKES